MDKNNTLVINLLSGPGAGKSTMAANIFAELKWNGINCEYVSEFAKDKVWEKSNKVFECQEYIFGKQSFRMKRLLGEVDVIVTDSPLIFSTIYNNDLGEEFNKVVVNQFKSYNNLNYFINRKKEYNPKGRFQTYDEARDIDNKILNKLNMYDIDFKIIEGDKEGVAQIVNEVLAIVVLNKLNK